MLESSDTTNHDGSYKQIFSYPEMMEELLQGFVHEEWIEEVDFSTLEKVNSSYVSEELLKREDDIIWKVQTKGEWIYIYLLLDFQSTNDPWMALRIMVYTGLLYQDLIKSGAVTSKDLLPPVFPIVLYNGANRWRATQELSELIQPLPKQLEAYRPSQRYFLLDEGRVPESELKKAEGALSEIIRLESCPELKSLSSIVARLIHHLKVYENDGLKQAITVWFKGTVPKKLNTKENISEINELKELGMLAERFQEWEHELHQQGMQQGEGIALERLLRKRFGGISAMAETKIAQATQQQIEQWLDNILDANSIEEVFQNPKS